MTKLNAIVCSLTLTAASLAMPGSKPQALQGSDTLHGVVSEIISTSGMQSEIQYVGGGSSSGEKAILEARQGLAPMSRAVSQQAEEQGAAKGIKFRPHVLGLDGIVVLVNDRNRLDKLDYPTLSRIYSCELTRWESVPGSGHQGEIRVYGRDQKSGTTELLKHALKLEKFGPCVKELATTAEVAAVTATEAHAVAYSGLPAQKPGNRALAVSRDSGAEAVAPTLENVRIERYPLSRKLFVYEAEGAVRPSAVESKLLNVLLDRRILDPILERHEFVTKN